MVGLERLELFIVFGKEFGAEGDEKSFITKYKEKIIVIPEIRAKIITIFLNLGLR